MALTPENQAKRATAKKAPAKKTTRAPAKTTAKEAPAKTTAKEAPAKTTAKEAPARTTAKKAPAKTRGQPPRPAPSHEAIAKRAHELYEAQGGGGDLAHWLQAERDLSSH